MRASAIVSVILVGCLASLSSGCNAPDASDGGRSDGGGPRTDAARPRDAATPSDAARPTDAGPEDPDADLGPLRGLLFTRTTGFRHDSIATGITALTALATARGWVLDATEDPTRFSDVGLAPYDVVIFLSTTGDPLDAGQQAAFERYVRAGGGFVGVHAAADCEYDWPFYGALVGAYFENHPAIQSATLNVEDRTHPATQHLDATWVRTDEWYNFQANPRDDVNVLITIDEASYSGGGDGADHPMAWLHFYEGGRAFYTALGHTTESYAEPDFRAHLVGAVEWAAGR